MRIQKVSGQVVEYVELTPQEEAAWLQAEQDAVVSKNSEDAKRNAIARIKAIREELVEHLADLEAGTPAEQGQARAAIGLLRAELAIEKAKT